jgi:hypothetical protein
MVGVGLLLYRLGQRRTEASATVQRDGDLAVMNAPTV